MEEFFGVLVVLCISSVPAIIILLIMFGGYHLWKNLRGDN